MADLIDRAAAIEWFMPYLHEGLAIDPYTVVGDIRAFRAVDAVEVEALKAWLYELAMNNTNNYLGDACEEIISRLDGLRVFARERENA